MTTSFYFDRVFYRSRKILNSLCKYIFAVSSAENVKRSKINKGCLPSTVAYSSAPNERYLWNKYLLDPVGGFDGEGVGEQNISQVKIVKYRKINIEFHHSFQSTFFSM